MPNSQSQNYIMEELKAFNTRMNNRVGESFNVVTFTLSLQKETHYTSDEIHAVLDALNASGDIKASSSQFVTILSEALAQDIPDERMSQDAVSEMLKHFKMRSGHVIGVSNVTAYFSNRLWIRGDEYISAINALADAGYLRTSTDNISLTDAGDQWLWS